MFELVSSIWIPECIQLRQIIVPHRRMRKATNLCYRLLIQGVLNLLLGFFQGDVVEVRVDVC